MGKIINPATNKPFVSASPSNEVRKIREEIIHTLKMRANYDAAQTTIQNQQHWVPANNLSPHAVNNLSTRKTLRNRSRYEMSNSGYLKGITLSLCQDFVGSGPTLQITDSRFQSINQNSDKPSPASIIERIWKQRAKKIKLRKKLWRIRHAKIQDGEGFAIAFNNRTLKHKVKVDQRIFECDQISNFDLNHITGKQRTLEIDGVRFDRQSGEPTSYYLLHEHPGETQIQSLGLMNPNDGKWIKADNVIHWFRQDRGWLRGIPESTYTLPLWALLRRYTLAVIQNAEIAADFTVLLKTMQMPFATGFGNDSTGDVSEANKELWFNGFPVDRGMITALPDMYDAQQLKPEQPVTVYDAFVSALVGEASRPLLTPRNVAMSNSGEYNMSSGVQDRQTYREAIKQERLDSEDEVLDKDLDQWWFEAIRTPDYFDTSISNDVMRIVNKFSDLRDEPPEHMFRWDEVPEHTDPYKVAQAVDLMFQAGHITEKDVQEGRFNRSVEEHHENRRQQMQRQQSLIDQYPDQFDIRSEPSNNFEDDEE